MEQLLGALAGFLFVILGIVIVIYIVTAIFLNKFNKLVYGKGTALAWIPIFDIYLLGKLTVNKIVGWILVICVFLTSTYSTTINEVDSTGSILPDGIRNVVSTIYGFAVLGLFIYAIIKYNKLKKEKLISQQTIQTPTQNFNPVIGVHQNVQAPIQNVNTSMPSQQQSVQMPMQGNNSTMINQQQPMQANEQNSSVENINNNFNNNI